MSSLSVSLASALARDNVRGEHALGIPDQLFDLLPAAAYVCDRDGFILRYNRRAAETWGRAFHVGDGNERQRAPHRIYRRNSGTSPHAECLLANVLRTGISARDQEAVIEWPDRSHVVALVNIDVIKDKDGNVVGAINCFLDISNRKPRGEDDLTGRIAGAARDESRGPVDAGDTQGSREPGNPDEVSHENGERAAEQSAMQWLQEISALLVKERNVDTLHHRVLDAAVGLMHADMASMQLLDHAKGELHLLAWKGFHPQSAKSWEWVKTDSGCPCGVALSRGERVVVPDVENCDFMVGTDNIAACRQSGIRAMQSTPLVSRSGDLLGMISTHWRQPHHPSSHELHLFDVLARLAADVIEHKNTEMALRKSEERYRSLFNSIDEGFCVIEMIFDEASRPVDYLFLEVNEAFESHTGLRNAVGRRMRAMAPAHEQHWFDRYARVAQSGKPERFALEAAALGRWYDVYAFRVDDPRSLRVAVLFDDITDRKQADEQQTLLLREMGHRIKNLFAITGSVVSLSARSAHTSEDLVKSIRGRLSALALAHDLIRPGLIGTGEKDDRHATLEALLQAIFSPYLDPQNAQAQNPIIFHGPDVPIGSNATTSLALVFHEFATNAVKYGALSVPAGSVEITWSVEGEELVLTWKERNGPSIEGPPADEGFGSLLARRSIDGQLGGRLSRDWNREGLVMHLAMPMERLT